MPRVYLSLGGNVGDRCANLKRAVGLLQQSGAFDDMVISPVYETSPVDYAAQNDFLNLALSAQTKLAPRELLALCQGVELEMCREKTVRFGPRNIDVDILFYDDLALDTADLVLPHPRLHQRLFVLKPLADLASDLSHPVLNKTVTELLRGLRDKTQQIKEYRC